MNTKCDSWDKMKNNDSTMKHRVISNQELKAGKHNKLQSVTHPAVDSSKETDEVYLYQGRNVIMTTYSNLKRIVKKSLSDIVEEESTSHCYGSIADEIRKG